MTKADNYLKQTYGKRYRVRKGEDGIWNLTTRHRPKDGTEFEVYDHSDTHLAACLPPQAARGLLRRFPDAFTLVQDASDAGVVAFEESRLDELADALKLRRRKQVSEKERERLRQMGRKHSPFLRGRSPESSKQAPGSTIGAGSALWSRTGRRSGESGRGKACWRADTGRPPDMWNADNESLCNIYVAGAS